MSTYDDELLKAARRLLARRTGQRGKLSGARVRRSISTSYYALFHFLLEEMSARIVGTRNDLRMRRRLLSRVVTHKGLKTALDKVGGGTVERSVQGFFQITGPDGTIASPRFAQVMASAFSDAQAKRHDADYNLNEPISEVDAHLLARRVKRVIALWRAANTPADKSFKHGLSILILLKGQLRADP